MTRDTRNLLLVHLPANAILLGLAYEWLAMAESSTARLAFSAFAALGIVALAALLHGASFASFRLGARPGIAASFRTALRHLLPLLMVVLGAISIYAFFAWWENYSPTPAAKLASWLTLQFRKPVKPATIQNFFKAALWMIRWALLPAELLPLFSGVAARGWRGFNEFGWRRYSRLYRLEVPLLALAAVWLPLRLINWVPLTGSFSMEMTSLVSRALVGYLIFVIAAMLLAFLTSREKPATAV